MKELFFEKILKCLLLKKEIDNLFEIRQKYKIENNDVMQVLL